MSAATVVGVQTEAGDELKGVAWAVPYDDGTFDVRASVDRRFATVAGIKFYAPANEDLLAEKITSLRDAEEVAAMTLPKMLQECRRQMGLIAAPATRRAAPGPRPHELH